MFNNNIFNNRLNRLNNNQFNGLSNDPYENTIYGILQQFNLEPINPSSYAESNMGKGIHNEQPPEPNLTTQEFIDEMFISLRTIYDAAITIDKEDNIEIKFSENCRFKIKITN